MFRDFDETAARVEAENELLVSFQREGAGLPQGERPVSPRRPPLSA